MSVFVNNWAQGKQSFSQMVISCFIIILLSHSLTQPGGWGRKARSGARAGEIVWMSMGTSWHSLWIAASQGIRRNSAKMFPIPITNPWFHLAMGWRGQWPSFCMTPPWHGLQVSQDTGLATVSASRRAALKKIGCKLKKKQLKSVHALQNELWVGTGRGTRGWVAPLQDAAVGLGGSDEPGPADPVIPQAGRAFCKAAPSSKKPSKHWDTLPGNLWGLHDAVFGRLWL